MPTTSYILSAFEFDSLKKAACSAFVEWGARKTVNYYTGAELDASVPTGKVVRITIEYVDEPKVEREGYEEYEEVHIATLEAA